MKPLKMLLAAAAATGLLTAGAHAQKPLDKVKVALAKSVSNGAMLIAVERGYFKDAGIDVEMSDIDTAADALSLVAQNQIQIVGAGVSAGYFNAVDRGLPVTITISRVAFPAGHNLMIRPDLKDEIKSMKDMKGRNIASNGPGSISTYEIGKMLEPHGLTLNDVNTDERAAEGRSDTAPRARHGASRPPSNPPTNRPMVRPPVIPGGMGTRCVVRSSGSPGRGAGAAGGRFGATGAGGGDAGAGGGVGEGMGGASGAVGESFTHEATEGTPLSFRRNTM